MDAGRIHTIELLEQALAAAEQLGYTVREDELAGRAGGACVLKGKKWLLLDPTALPRERLEQVIQSLRVDPAIDQNVLPATLRRAMQVRKVA